MTSAFRSFIVFFLLVSLYPVQSKALGEIPTQSHFQAENLAHLLEKKSAANKIIKEWITSLENSTLTQIQEQIQNLGVKLLPPQNTTLSASKTMFRIYEELNELCLFEQIQNINEALAKSLSQIYLKNSQTLEQAIQGGELDMILKKTATPHRENAVLKEKVTPLVQAHLENEQILKLVEEFDFGIKAKLKKFFITQLALSVLIPMSFVSFSNEFGVKTTIVLATILVIRAITSHRSLQYILYKHGLDNYFSKQVAQMQSFSQEHQQKLDSLLCQQRLLAATNSAETKLVESIEKERMQLAEEQALEEQAQGLMKKKKNL